MTDRNCVAEHYRDPERPRRAAEGSMLCAGCESRLAKQLENLPGLYADVIAGSRKASSTGPVKGDPERPMPATGTQLDARELVRATLVPWCRIVAEGREVDPPADDVPAMCAFLERHRLWLCGHDAAAEFADEIAHVTSEALRAAYPGGRSRVAIGECPTEIEHADGELGPCSATVYAYPEQPLIECERCGTSDTLDWWTSVMVDAAGKLLTGTALAAVLSSRYNRPITPTQVRDWARRGQVSRAGTDPKGRVLYDRTQAVAYADRLYEPVKRHSIVA